MNCAFAIGMKIKILKFLLRYFLNFSKNLGRICDNENGRLAFLQNSDASFLIESLSKMIEDNVDNGCTKNACYALSCIAVNQQAHQIIIEHKSFLNLIDILCKLLLTVKDPETQWFAAM